MEKSGLHCNVNDFQECLKMKQEGFSLLFLIRITVVKSNKYPLEVTRSHWGQHGSSVSSLSQHLLQRCWALFGVTPAGDLYYKCHHWNCSHHMVFLQLWRRDRTVNWWRFQFYGQMGNKGMKWINRVILEEQLSWSLFSALKCSFWVSRCVERTGQVPAATPDPKD